VIKNLIQSIYSGLCIGLGGTAYLSCDNKVLGSFLFGLGLFSTLMLKSLVVITVGNSIGGGLIPLTKR